MNNCGKSVSQTHCNLQLELHCFTPASWHNENCTCIKTNQKPYPGQDGMHQFLFFPQPPPVLEGWSMTLMAHYSKTPSAAGEAHQQWTDDRWWQCPCEDQDRLAFEVTVRDSSIRPIPIFAQVNLEFSQQCRTVTVPVYLKSDPGPTSEP